MLWRRNSQPYKDKSVRTAMDEKLIKSMIGLGKGIVDMAMNQQNTREKELERQIANLRLEQVKIAQEKEIEAEQREKISALEMIIKSNSGQLHDLDLKIQKLSIQEQEELDKIKKKYEELRLPTINIIKDLELENRQCREAIKELDKKDIIGPKPVVRYLAQETNVQRRESLTGAADMYALVDPLHGKIDFIELSNWGPAHSKSFNCQLIISFPHRSKPLRIIIEDSGKNKKDLKNCMCATIIDKVKQWIPDLTICGDVHLHPGPIIKLGVRSMNVVFIIDQCDLPRPDTAMSAENLCATLKAIEPGMHILACAHVVTLQITLRCFNVNCNLIVTSEADGTTAQNLMKTYKLLSIARNEFIENRWFIDTIQNQLQLLGTEDEKRRGKFDRLQLIKGNVEQNPGPVWSRDLRQPHILPPSESELQDIFYMRQYKQMKKMKRRDINRINKTNIDIPKEDIKISQEEQVENDTTKYFRRQRDEINKRTARDYRSKHGKLRNSPYSGEIVDDINQFWLYLKEHGYASDCVQSFAPAFIQGIFEKWCRSGRLVDCKTAKIIWKKNGKFLVDDRHDAHYRARKLLIRAFVATDAKQKDINYIRVCVNKIYQMSNKVDLTLKDVYKAQVRMKRKKVNWMDMKAIKEQMYGAVEHAVDNDEKETWFGGTMRSIGNKIGQGMTDVVMPVLNNVKQTVRNVIDQFSLKTVWLVTKILALCLLVAIFGWALVTLTRAITMGIDSFIPPEMGECEDLSQVKLQHFSYSTVKMVASSWYETFEGKLASFNKVFSDSEMTKWVKTLGNFSSAVKNVTWLLEKIKDAFVWVINRTSMALCDRPFFQDAKNVMSLQKKILGLMEVVNTTDVSEMVDQKKQEFHDAYRDLVEMAPFIFKIDKTLGAQINLAITKATPLYKSCKFYLQSNITRMEPFYIAIEGPAGQGKTYLMGHLSKMIYDCIRMMSPKTFFKLYYKGEEGQFFYSDALVYNRKTEQEYWDNYNNQPVTRIDDLGQSLNPETRASEFFSVIRMVNNDPYPLHMADVMRKETTVFTSFLVLSSTNMSEQLFKREGELQIVEPSAYLRRRDYSIKCTRSGEYIKQGVESKEYIDGYDLQVYRPSKSTGELGPVTPVKGYDEIVSMARDMAEEIIARHNRFFTGSKMDHTGTIASMLHADKEASSLINEIRYNHEQEMKSLEDAWELKQQALIKQFEEKMEKERKKITQEYPKRKKIKEVNIDGTDDNIPLKDSRVVDETTWQIDKLFSDIGFDDLSNINTQMLLPLTAATFVASKVNNYYYKVHPETILLLHRFTGSKITSYETARQEVKRLAIDHPMFDDPKWNHQYIVDGPNGGTRFQGYFELALGRFRSVNTQITKELRTIIGEDTGVSIYELDIYIGLSNSIYYEPEPVKKRLKNVMRKHGLPCYFYDEVIRDYKIEKQLEIDGSGGTREVLKSKGSMLLDMGEYEKQIAFEMVNEQALRASRGRSIIDHSVKRSLKVWIGMAGLGLVIAAAVLIYRKYDPTREVDMEFVKEQSSDPRMNKNQREIAKARALPKHKMSSTATNMAKIKMQFVDANADQLQYIIRKNTYIMRFDWGNGQEGMNHAVGIEDDIFVVPGHSMARKPTRIFMSKVDGNIEYEFEMDTVTYQYVRPIGGLSSADLALVRFPGIPFVKRITHLLFKEATNLNLSQGICREISKLNDQGEREYIMCEAPEPVRITNSSNYGCKEEGQKRYVMGLAKFRMSQPSDQGDCGHMYIYHNPAITEKLGWVHVAELDGMCVAGRLNQEDVERFKQILDSNLSKIQLQFRSFTINEEPDILSHHEKHIKFEPSELSAVHGIPTIGKLSVAMPSPGKSNIIPTPMCKPTQILHDGITEIKQPPFPVVLAPAVLRKKDDKDPMTIGLESCKNRKIIYGGHLQSEDYKGIFNDALRNSTARVLSISEAILGVRNHPYSHSMKRSSSMGFYHKMFNKLKRHYVDFTPKEFLERKNASKSEKEWTCFRMIGNGVFVHEDILTLVKNWFTAIKKKKVSMNWVIAMLKDELRPLDRVKACKSRVFYAGSFAFLIVCRMIFGEFVTELEAHWDETDIAVGCNPYSIHWRIIFDKITKFGEDVMDDDTKGWDQHFPTTEFCTTFPEEYIKYYELEKEVVRIDIMDWSIEIPHTDLVYGVTIANFHCAVVINDQVVYLNLQASGVDMTTIFNSVCNSAVNRCIVRKLTGKPFDEVAAMWVFGDDLMLSVIGITRKQIWEAAKLLFNHTRTDPSKGNTLDTPKIWEVFFIARQFKHEASVMLCPLKIESINGMLQWVEKPKDTTFEKQFAVNCKTALMELSRHGKEKYELYQQEINIYLRQYGKSWPIKMSYEEALQDTFFRVLF